MNNPEDPSAKTERRDAAENRQRILEAAQRLFEQYGVEQVSMNQIANEAGIGTGTLYRRYKNKGDLCLYLLKDNLAKFFNDIDQYLRHHTTDEPRQRLREVLRFFIYFRDKNFQLLTEVEVSTFDNKSHAIMVTPVYHRMHEIIVKLLSQITVSEPNEPNNVFKADMLLYALLNSDSYVFQRDIRGYSPEMFLEQLCLTYFPTR